MFDNLDEQIANDQGSNTRTERAIRYVVVAVVRGVVWSTLLGSVAP